MFLVRLEFLVLSCFFKASRQLFFFFFFPLLFSSAEQIGIHNGEQIDYRLEMEFFLSIFFIIYLNWFDKLKHFSSRKVASIFSFISCLPNHVLDCKVNKLLKFSSTNGTTLGRDVEVLNVFIHDCYYCFVYVMMVIYVS